MQSIAAFTVVRNHVPDAIEIRLEVRTCIRCERAGGVLSYLRVGEITHKDTDELEFCHTYCIYCYRDSLGRRTIKL